VAQLLVVSMKRVAIVGAVVTSFALLLAAAYWVWPIIRFVHSLDVQMKTGQKRMDSITERDIALWVSRTEGLLKSYGGETAETPSLEGRSVPADLQELGILRVDVLDSNTVLYVWLGGMDHTWLKIQRANGSNFTFTARYNDESNRVIWPKN